MNNLDNHLARRDAAQHVLAHSFFLDLSDEIFDHRQRDVGFEQRHAHFAEGFCHVAFFERAPVSQLAEYRSQALLQGIKHRVSSSLAQREKRQCANLRGLADRHWAGSTVENRNDWTGQYARGQNGSSKCREGNPWIFSGLGHIRRHGYPPFH